MVYFVEYDGLIKIGFSKNPSKRIRALMDNSPMELIPRLIIDGGFDLEQSLHDKFRNDRYKGEWHFKSQAIADFIESKAKDDLRYDLGLMYNAKEINGETTRIRQQARFALREVAELIGITPQSVKEIEMRELMGTVSLNVLKKYAKAMDHRLVYKFVPVTESDTGEDDLD